jgi:hypothetical protein
MAFGFHNITANNGWAMAVVGASIVFTGLAVLSFAISQIHKILELWDEKDKYLSRFKKQASEDEKKIPQAPVYTPARIPTADELARIYRPLVDQLKEPFELIQLFEKAEEMGLAHPHLSLKQLREAGYLTPQEKQDMFTWNKK